MTTANLLVSCDDRTGIVATLSQFVFVNGGNILDADQHAEEESGRFFMRLAFTVDEFSLDRAGIAAALSEMAAAFTMKWRIRYDDRRQRVALFASRTPHCLYDLLLRQRMGELGGDIVLVVSNHTALQPVTEYFGLPFYHFPMADGDKTRIEEAQLELLAREAIDLVVLARYMQILSPGFVAAWDERIINIHHSFLPAFTGARPYHQAKRRGVKVIGATAHYVTAELDQGPIIDQDVTRVSHRDEVRDLVRKGRDLERQVLARAVRRHLDHRVLVQDNRTIVFA